MFTLYIPKYANSSSPFFVNEIVRKISEYIISSGYTLGVFLAPGYLSKTEKTIDIFTDVIPFSNIKNQDAYIGIFRGVNGYDNVLNGKSTILHCHRKKYSKHCWKYIQLCCNKESKDHRKMIFFFSPLVKSLNCIRLKSHDIEKFLKEIRVDFVLIGSSNQSKQTYFGDAQGHADKGEADMLLFYDEKFLEVLVECSNPKNNGDFYIPINESTENENDVNSHISCVLSSTSDIKSRGYFGEPSRNYLKNILREYMRTVLV